MSSDLSREDSATVADLYPPLYDHAFFALVVLAAASTVVALVRLGKSKDTGLLDLVAFIAILVVPIAGATSYLYLARRRPAPDPTQP